MAHIVGYKKEAFKGIPTAHIFLIIIVTVALIGFMLDPEDNWKDNIFSLLGTVAVIVIIVGFALNKVNPRGWMQIFKKAEFERLLQADLKILATLQSLNNDHYVMYDFNFELLHVEFLVLGPQGMFVVGKVTSPEQLRVEAGTLMAGNEPLSKQTGNLWRICHLINIVIKKGYKEEIMPQPILVATHCESVAIAEYDGIAIVKSDELASHIQNHSTDDTPFALVQGFADYLNKRYFK